MKFGFSTYFFTRNNVVEMMEEAMAQGIRVFELSYEIPHVLRMDEKFLHYLEDLRGRGIEFSMHAPFFEVNVGSFFEDIRLITLQKVKKALDMAARIGASPVVVHPGYSFLVRKVKEVEEQTRSNFIEDFAEICRYGKERGIKVALENVHIPFCFFYNLSDFAGLAEKLPGLSMTLDVGHAYMAQRAKGGDDPEGAILSDLDSIGADRLAHVHLHNNGGSRDDHGLVRGRMDLKRIIAGLDAMGYKEKVIIESYDMEQLGTAAVVEKLGLLRPSG